VWTSGSVVITDQKYNQRTNETKFPETFGLREGKMKKKIRGKDGKTVPRGMVWNFVQHCPAALYDGQTKR